MIWVKLVPVLLWLGSCGGLKQNEQPRPRHADSNKAISCSPLPTRLTFARNDSMWSYKPAEASLSLDFDDFLFFSRDWCSIQEQGREVYYPHFKVDLISTIKEAFNTDVLKSREAVREKCRKMQKGSFIQDSVILDVNKTSHVFHYVQGLYYMRLSACKKVGKDGLCQDDLICSQPLTLKAEVDKNTDVCEYEFPNNVSADIIDTSSRLIPRFGHSLQNDSQNWFCDIAIRAVIPLCTGHQTYDTVTVTAVPVAPGDTTCNFAEFHQDQGNLTNVARLKPCTPEIGCFQLSPSSYTPTEQGDPAVLPGGTPVGVLEHEVHRISRNASYCLFFRLNNPHCRGDAGCVFYTQTLTCDLLRPPQVGFKALITQPVFIGAVSCTLFLSLALLMWTVIQCSQKKPGTPLLTSNGSNAALSASLAVKKPPPRSLTEDDLEHISRLPSQEIVLVYFPDTPRFKDLNRKLRDWLITLDVNDVKDIYDEKCSEEVLKDPEGWVRSTLAGPEKRIILVCSKLAYECLKCIKRGISSPKFVETDPHFGLLTRTIQYLDREMRGNYRNLICVRYEDLKICSRNYSSEVFNIVPGTEYVLPQHLEDVYRWIHPRDPKPECWDEDKAEVRTLLDSIRQYRHHDENIFTVQFSEDATDSGGGGNGTGPIPDVHTPLCSTENQSPFTKRRLQITQNL